MKDKSFILTFCGFRHLKMVILLAQNQPQFR